MSSALASQPVTDHVPVWGSYNSAEVRPEAGSPPLSRQPPTTRTLPSRRRTAACWYRGVLIVPVAIEPAARGWTVAALGAADGSATSLARGVDVGPTTPRRLALGSVLGLALGPATAAGCGRCISRTPLPTASTATTRAAAAGQRAVVGSIVNLHGIGASRRCGPAIAARATVAGS